MDKMDRRNFMSFVAGGMATPFVMSAAVSPVMAASETGWSPSNKLAPFPINTANPASVFDVSVASGDPTPTGFMIWTHIRQEKYDGFSELRFQVAQDPDFKELVLEGLVAASDFAADRDHTVKIDLDGTLGSDRHYYYRFHYRNTTSRVGRARTAPAEQAQVGKLKFALLTCQDYTNGYYGALNYLAEDNSIDYVLHLGDFIYESVGDPRYQSTPFADRRISLPSGFSVAMDLVDFRHLYRVYRSDLNFQRAMENHTWIITTDDHETCNDCYWDYDLDTLGCPDHPYTNDPQFGNNSNLKRQLKLDAQRAWMEYVPARVKANEAASHPFDFSQIYRNFRFGNLVSLSMLDTRTYRSPHPCGEGDVLERYVPLGCNDYQNPDRSMLGQAQREWLINTWSASSAQWNVLGNQTYMGRLGIDLGDKVEVPFNVDAWDGYQAERALLMQEVQSNQVDNFVVLTGDLHSYIASQVKVDYGDFNLLNTRNQLGVEFMTPAVTSAGLGDAVAGLVPDADVSGFLTQALSETAVRTTNPHIKMFNSVDHGYSTVEFTEDFCEWVAYKVDKDIDSTTQGRIAISRMRKYEWWPWLVRLSTRGY